MSELFERAKRRVPRVLPDTDTFTINGIAGQGVWAVVYDATHKDTGERVALKFIDPSDEGLEIMQRRGMTIEDIALADHRNFAANANVVPTRMHRSRDGALFAEMPYFERFFEEEFQQRKSHVPDKPPSGMFRSGLHLDEIISYGRDAVNGLAEYQASERRPHCDLLASNTAMMGHKLVISDPATTIGHPYVRSPWAAAAGRVTLASDSFNFASFLYNLFSGKYLLQDEVDDAYAEDGLPGVLRMLEGLDPSKNAGLAKKLEEKLSEGDMPKAFRGLIREATLERFENAGQLRRAYDLAVREYHETVGKRRFIKEFGRRAAAVFGVGAVIGSFVYLAASMAPKPDYTYDFDIDTNVSVVPVEDAKVELQFEMDYRTNRPSVEWKGQIPDIDFSAQDENKQVYEFSLRKKDRSVADEVASAILHAAADLGVELPYSEMGDRYRMMDPINSSPSIPIYSPQYRVESLRYLAGYGLSAARNLPYMRYVDAEDAMVVALVGAQALTDAMKQENDHYFREYHDAKFRLGVASYDHIDVIPKDIVRVIRRAAAELQATLPEDTQYTPDFTLPD